MFLGEKWIQCLASRWDSGTHFSPYSPTCRIDSQAIAGSPETLKSLGSRSSIQNFQVSLRLYDGREWTPGK